MSSAKQRTDDSIKDQAKRKRASNALDFLNSHPAFFYPCSMDFIGNNPISMLLCCKRGHQNTTVTIHRGDKGWKKFEEQFKKEDEEYQEKTDYIYVDYKDVYGEKWKFDHVEYYYDIDIFVFEGDPDCCAALYDYQQYQRYHGFEGSAKTFEDAIIQCATKTKKMFGNFDIEKNFFTEEERENHEAHDFFLLDFCTDGIMPNIDPDYMAVTESAKNVRWAQWFSQTDLYKKDYPAFKKDVLKRKWDGIVTP